jgi:Glycosyl transferase family 11.
MSLIVFHASKGRLGNQLFHLAALDKMCRFHDVGVLIGARGLRQNFVWTRRNVIVLSRRSDRLCNLLRSLAARGLASYYIEEKLTEGVPCPFESGQLERRVRSIVPISFVENAYLQSDAWVGEKFRDRLRFKPETVQAVNTFARQHAIDWETTIFVHVRRTDYTDFSINNSGSVALPPSYYRQGIRKLETQLPVSIVLIVTDDPAYAAVEFADVPRKIVVSRAPDFDLCAMSHCATGVLSASSFSWWGAMLGPLRIRPVAPRHWIGWRVGTTIPSGIVSQAFDALAVV